MSDIDGRNAGKAEAGLSKPRGSGSEQAASASKRREVSRLQEALNDMLDHLAVIEARVKAGGSRRYSTAEVKKALGI